jgi:hypothetical protein
VDYHLRTDQGPTGAGDENLLRVHTTQQVKKAIENKVVRILVIKSYRGSGGIAPLILNPGTKWR